MTFRSSLAYARPETPARSCRSVEYELLARATHQLKAAWLGRTADFPALAAALHYNQQIWSALAVDVANHDNGLPAALRARLFYLYEFTAHHSRAILADRGSVEVLTEINTAVMRGLRGESGAS